MVMADSQQPTLFAEAEIAEMSNGLGTTTGSNHNKRPKKVKEPLTSKQQLSSIIKSVRDDLRKDAGLSGNTDRLPQLTWLLFLKSFNDFDEAYQEMLGTSYAPVIEAPYRWRDWADVEDKAERKTGDELLEFVSNALIPCLARLSGPNERDMPIIVGTIFQGTSNRIRSGYILRSVVDKLNGINFTSSDDIHAVSHFYETMLKEMHDAAGSSGEFYTPRPVVRFIINRLNPKLGERIMDPACGTAGFLVEAYEQLRSSNEVRIPDQLRKLEESLIGIEKKPMPYLPGMMNMRLHGVETPNLSERNALAVNIRQIRDAERVDIIATNPPFGAAEEQGILNNFPDSFRSSETAILFFQYIIAMLKRPGGRCGVVLPDGFLFGNGVAALVKKQLLTRFNLHTIVRLPNVVFAPYTPIPTNLLFFDACTTDALEGDKACTKEVWYYELSAPEGRSNYSKTKPLQHEAFADCITWWDNRVENEQAWKVPVEQLLANDCNLDVKNPSSRKDSMHVPPEQLAKSIIEKEQRVLKIKVLAINDLYYARCSDTISATDQIISLKAKEKYSEIEQIEDYEAKQKAFIELVNKIAKHRRQLTDGDIVFASKFAHFFINDEAFPIVDDDAESMLQYYFGKRQLGQSRKTVSEGQRYTLFCGQFSVLKQGILALNSNYQLNNKPLDHFLWLASICEKLKQNQVSGVNPEFREKFDKKDQLTMQFFNMLFPDGVPP